MKHLALALLVLVLALPAMAEEPFEIRTSAVPLNPEDKGQTQIGELSYRAGFVLTSPWDGFGGLSGMALGEDGKLDAVSDAGAWLEMRLEHGEDGTLTGVAGMRRGILQDPTGTPVTGKLKSDAESLAALDEGGLLVAFEREHRLWQYPREDGFTGLPQIYGRPDDVERAEPNSGMEAVVELAGGRVLVLAEDLRDERGDHTGWLGDPLLGYWKRLTLAATESFLPTGLARLPDGDLVLVERSFDESRMLLKTRLSRIRSDAVDAGARLETEELARLTPPLTNDNLEAVAARRGPGGETLIYVLSDDNFNRDLQRTLLLQFALGD